MVPLEWQNPKRVMSPAALERLPIPSHWPGEPEWLRQRAVEQVTGMEERYKKSCLFLPLLHLSRHSSTCLADSESDEEPTQTVPPVSTPKSALQR